MNNPAVRPGSHLKKYIVHWLAVFAGPRAAAAFVVAQKLLRFVCDRDFLPAPRIALARRRSMARPLRRVLRACRTTPAWLLPRRP